MSLVAFNAKGENRTMNNDLLSRSSEFEKIVADIAMDQDNVVRCEINFEKMRPLVDTDIQDGAFCSKDSTISGFYSYEDAGIVTGMFLASQAIRYKATKDIAAMSNAQRAFEGIRWIYNLGKLKEEGFLPKPYDKKFSEQLSRDQYLFAMAGMKEFYDITDHQTKKEIETMMGAMARYWITIDYTQTYLGLPATSQLSDFMGSLFLGIIRLGYEFSKDQVLLTEYNRLINEEKLGERMQETLRSRFLQNKTYDGGMYFRAHEHCMTMKTVATKYLWEYDQENRKLWTEALNAFWEDDLQVGYDQNDGLCYFTVKFDREKNTSYPINAGIIAELENPLKIPVLNWGGHHKTAISSQLAYCSLVRAVILKDSSSAKLAKSILEKLTLDKFRGYTVPNDTHVPPGELYRKNIMTLNFLCSWLWTYWLGREKNVW